MSITATEILALIREVAQPIELQTMAATVAANAAYGIPAQPQVTTRSLRGYVVPEKARWMPAEGQAVTSGNWTAYISAVDLQPQDITGSTRIRWDGRTYTVEYLQGIYHRGQVMVHKLRLVQTQATEVYG